VYPSGEGYGAEVREGKIKFFTLNGMFC